MKYKIFVDYYKHVKCKRGITKMKRKRFTKILIMECKDIPEIYKRVKELNPDFNVSMIWPMYIMKYLIRYRDQFWNVEKTFRTKQSLERYLKLLNKRTSIKHVTTYKLIKENETI